MPINLTLFSVKNAGLTNDEIDGNFSSLLSAINSLFTFANDLTGLGDKAAARTNLGLGTAATQASGSFAEAAHTHSGYQAASLVLSGLAAGTTALSGRNKLRNGNFAINQRNVSDTVTLAAFAYGHDGFKAGAGGCTYTFSTAENKTTLTITAGTLIQVADGANLQNGTYIIGYEGTAPVRLNGGVWGASGLTNVVVGGVNQTVEWGVGTVSLVQYEPGTVRTTFEFRDDEIDRCRVYCRAFPINTWIAAGTLRASLTGAYLYSVAAFGMRANPSVSYAGALPFVFVGDAAVTITSLSFSQMGGGNVIHPSIGSSAGQAVAIITGSLTILSAEQ